MKRCRHALFFLMSLVLVGCQSPAYEEQGWASYIADSYAGRMTSSGQIYNPGYSTAAHNSLPFGTQLTVKNLATGRSVQVMVNDRFPSYPGRVVNISASAAQYIGMNPRQISPVKVTAKEIPQGGYGYAGGYAPPRQPPVYSSQPSPGYQGQAYAPQSYGQQPAPQTYTRQAPAYPQQAGRAPAAPAQVPAQAPAASRPSFFQRMRGRGTPSAESYQGGNAPPAGLPTF